MKKIIIVGLFSILFAFTSHAQRNYSVKNLEQVSQERLDVLLKRAKTKKVIAGVLTGVGVTSFIVGVASDNIGASMFGGVGGVIMTLIVVPVTIINSSRVKKVEGVMKSRSESVFIDIAPYRFKNNMAGSYQNGVSLRLNF